jgi:transposase-like protein
MAAIDSKKIICPKCNKKEIIRYGWQEGKQIYFCKDCKKKFRTNRLKNKTYSSKIITNAITYYNLGNTLNETVKLINMRFKVKISKSCIHKWIKEFSSICSYKKLRSRVVKKYSGNIIDSFSFQHSGLTYNFTYHIPKLEFLAARFPSLIRFILDMEKECPSDFFKEDERCSQLKIDAKIKKEGKYNQACRLADLALRACYKNCERHNFVENFMLINDSTTIACEVPVWFWEKNFDLGICGHIDLLQIRRNKIFILDFKPGASKEKEKKVVSQLYFYASGLSFRTKVPLDLFRCAWFDEIVYYEFNPMNLKVKMLK